LKRSFNREGMAMRISSPKLTLGIFSIIVGILIASQMKLNVDQITPVTIQSIIAARNELNSVRNEIVDLEKTIAAKEEELRLLESIGEGEANLVDILCDLHCTNYIAIRYQWKSGADRGDRMTPIVKICLCAVYYRFS